VEEAEPEPPQPATTRTSAASAAAEKSTYDLARTAYASTAASFGRAIM
jgi:hypothetical protein